MKAVPSSPRLFIPDQEFPELALARTTHLGIGAHQDDLEFMALHGIAECFRSEQKWFGGIICTDGTGSSATGPFADIPARDLARLRAREQILAAEIGRYSFVSQLGFSSSNTAQPSATLLSGELAALLEKTRPEVVYTHSPADKHPTHLGVLVAVLEALILIPATHRPKRLLGCEMWRSLDWLSDVDKVVLDVSGHSHLAACLNGVFDSQIAGGKRYDLAVKGRRQANATLLNAHAEDQVEQAEFAIDLTPLIGANVDDLVEFTLQHVDRFRDSIESKLTYALGR